ncbi:MAG: DUF502 domain-containing protein [Candidatus Hydrogenedentes bacterium]|nr:DUF502 domain-containing protein [Candidatus Hydrogenedentota bacterium]
MISEKTAPRRSRPRVLRILRLGWRQFWRHLVAGLLVWIPLITTLWVSWFFLNKFVLGIERLIKDFVTLLNHAGERSPSLEFLRYVPYRFGLGFLLVFLIFWVTGFLTRYIIGLEIIAFGERIVQRIPFIRTVYRAVKQIRDTFIGRQGAVFQNVCLVEYPRPGMYAVAFVTSREKGVVQEMTDKELVAVFVPTTPNPTSGYLVYLPPEDVAMLDIGVEDAMKIIISGGAYLPGVPDRIEAKSDLDAIEENRPAM